MFRSLGSFTNRLKAAFPREMGMGGDSEAGETVPSWMWHLDGVVRLQSGLETDGRWPCGAELSRWTDELLEHSVGELTHERIGPLGPNRRRVIARVENFCAPQPPPAQEQDAAAAVHHADWRAFATGPLQEAVSSACGEPMELYKEKLNLKPAGGGGGFAPHIDSPSLRAFSPAEGGPWPREFVTAMVAIDEMTSANGCLRLARPAAGTPRWSEEDPPNYDPGDTSKDPDAEGRAGALVPADGKGFSWEDLPAKAGEAWLFNGWVPHRSSANNSDTPRRAVFFTYNPAREGNVRERYYTSMAERRTAFQEKLAQRFAQQQLDALNDAAGLLSIPKSAV
ncbi:hypothetical protein CYMTET_50460 [Cymbomonas tetramitiformis]|uniref:Phytanoyl-CoA dioxygenase n=1 Tax=Cymbomonas tetramitiformis TaxID=36881 RepID=A0AAE0BN00_9CHLO|nr:hypothetical protein CYMTET_50460 [Cymbomonas tetramitiformis]